MEKVNKFSPFAQAYVSADPNYLSQESIIVRLSLVWKHLSRITFVARFFLLSNCEVERSIFHK